MSSLVEDIAKKRLNILNEIEELKTTSNISEVQKQFRIGLIQNHYLPEYWKNEMERDLPNVSQIKRDEILSYMKEFISLGIEKEYFTDDTILDVLQQLTYGISKFWEKDVKDSFGTWAGTRNDAGSLAIQTNLNGNFLRHVIFHELTHCITPDIGIPPKLSNGQDVFSPTSIAFLRELMAEATACDLSSGYKEQRIRVHEKGADLTSDWWIPWNCKYQQLGDEFLKTIPFINTENNNTDRKRFKELTRMAIRPDNNIAIKIYNEYIRKNPQNGSNELNVILLKLEELMDHRNFTKEDVSYIREKMKPYTPTFIIKKREFTQSHDRSDIPQFKILRRPQIQTEQHFQINPQHIANTGRNLSTEQPGILSKGLEKVKKFFNRDRGDTRDK